MGKISVETYAGSAACDAPEGFSGQYSARSYFNQEAEPIRLHVFSLERGDRLTIEATATDRLAYVWKGEAEAGGRCLTCGSSMIVEHGATLDVIGRDEQTRFTMSHEIAEATDTCCDDRPSMSHGLCGDETEPLSPRRAADDGCPTVEL